MTGVLCEGCGCRIPPYKSLCWGCRNDPPDHLFEKGGPFYNGEEEE